MRDNEDNERRLESIETHKTLIRGFIKVFSAVWLTIWILWFISEGIEGGVLNYVPCALFLLATYNLFAFYRKCR